LVAAGLLLLAAGASTPAAEGPAWHVDHPDVHITVPLKPGGAFAATSTALTGTLRLADTAAASRPLKLAGEIALDLGTIDTGIALRNRHLRENYLEIAKGAGFDKAVLSNIQIADADGEAFDGSSAFTANLLLHGMSREISGKAEVRREGDSRRVRAEFPLTMPDFGITPPEYLGVGVGSRLMVKVQFMATPAAGSARD